MGKKKSEDFWEKNKTHIGVLLVTLVLFGTGVFLLRSESNSAPIKIEESEDSVKGTSSEKQTGEKSQTKSNVEEKNNLININTASSKELESLPGIGPTLAERIIEYRETNGDFDDVSDVKKVSGIGEGKFSEIESLICVE